MQLELMTFDWSVILQSDSVDYGQIYLVDSSLDFPGSESLVLDSRGLAVAKAGRLTLISGGSGHTPTVELQAWTEEPPPDSDNWRISVTVDVEFPTGEIVVGGTAPWQGPAMLLPYSATGEYRAYIYMSGGSDEVTVEDLVLEVVDEVDPPYRFERWLIQFLPREDQITSPQLSRGD